MKEKMSGIWDNILFLGKRTDVDRLYQAMDVFMLPSRYEGLPVVAIEAQMSGVRTVISKNVSSEAVLSASTVVMELSSGPEAWANAAKGGREMCSLPEDIRRKYDISIQAETMVEHYEELLAKCNKAGTAAQRIMGGTTPK